MRRDPGDEAFRAVLDYLVRLSDPITINEQELPGRWTKCGPTGRRPDDRFPGGHANPGMAHGIALI